MPPSAVSRRLRSPGLAWIATFLAWLAAAPVSAELPVEATGRVLTLPAPTSHWAFAADPLLRRSALVDLDSGKMLGMVSGGFGPVMPLLAPSRRELLVSETHYSRGSRGQRTDVLTIYDASTLGPVGEVVLPPKRAVSAVPSNHSALSDDERLAAVFNLTPATSISVVDAVERRLAGEIPTPGCSLLYPVSGRRFAMLCLDGAMLVLGFDERGAEISRVRSEPFFDPQTDPIIEKGARLGDRWLFPSFEGRLVEVDLSGGAPVFPEPWSLFEEADRADDWRVGGTQPVAIHPESGRLFLLVHQGGVDTHKEPGTEIWVYDLAERERVQRIEVASGGLTFMGFPIEPPQSWIWPFGGLARSLIGAIGSGLGADEIHVTRGDEALLVSGSSFTGGLALYDAVSGRFLRQVYTGNMTNFGILVPFGDAP